MWKICIKKNGKFYHKLSSIATQNAQMRADARNLTFIFLHLNNERQRVEKVKVEPLLDIYKAKKTIIKSLLIPNGDWRTKGNFSLLNAEITKKNERFSFFSRFSPAACLRLCHSSLSFVSVHNILSAKLHACLRGRRYLLEASLVVDIAFIVLGKVKRRCFLGWACCLKFKAVLMLVMFIKKRRNFSWIGKT